MGRISIIKMDILPKILYIFQTIPIFPSTKILIQLRKAIGSFIWAGKTARISREVLIKLKQDGGLALPDLLTYLKSVFNTRIMDWFHNADSKQWVRLEEEVAAIKLKSLPWIVKERQTPEGELPFLVGSTLKVWDGILKLGIGSTYRGPMTPLFDNPEFPPARDIRNYLLWQRNEDTWIVETMEGNRHLPIEALGMEYRTYWMQYRQIDIG